MNYSIPEFAETGGLVKEERLDMFLIHWTVECFQHTTYLGGCTRVRIDAGTLEYAIKVPLDWDKEAFFS